MSLWKKHAIFETNSILLVIGVLIVIAIGGLVEITPLFYLEEHDREGRRASAPTRRSSLPAATSTCARAATTATRR